MGFTIICDNCGQKGRIDKKDDQLYSEKFSINGNDEEWLRFMCLNCLHSIEDD